MDFFEGRYISSLLILISVIVSLIVWQNKHLLEYGMNGDAYRAGKYGHFFKQVGLFQFIHGDILHLVMNGYFLYIAGPLLEQKMGEVGFILFFIVSTLVNVIALLALAPKSNTIGISGFCMALLSYLWITLYTAGSPDATNIGTLLVINIAFGFVPGISLVGHASGAVAGIAFWFLTSSIF